MLNDCWEQINHIHIHKFESQVFAYAWYNCGYIKTFSANTELEKMFTDKEHHYSTVKHNIK